MSDVSAAPIMISPLGLLQTSPVNQTPAALENPQQMLQKAMQLFHSWHFEECVALAKTLHESAPEHVDYINLYALATLQAGRPKDAAPLLRKAIKLSPTRCDLFRNLAAAERLDADGDDVKAMEGLLNFYLPPDDRQNILFALALIYDRAGRFDDAIRVAHEGNQIRRRKSGFNPEVTQRSLDNLRSAFQPQLFDERYRQAGVAGEKPVLIVGMPRSGSTLVESLLAAHPDVAAGDELKILAQFCRELAKQHPKIPVELSMSKLSDKGANLLGENYFARLNRVDSSTRYVTDKMPHNYLRLGMLALIAPDAKIIDVKRDPRDCCLSCYLHQFPEGLDFTNDLKELGEHYSAYEELMDFWKQVLPLSIHTVHYEELINDQEKVTRELLEFLDLPWHDGCLEFHKQKRSITTSSLLQVQKPLYKSALAHWKNYEEALQPLIGAVASLNR